MQVFQGLLLMALGMLILVFRPRIKEFTGNIGFAERYLGPGGTWTFYILLGVAFFIIGLMWGLGTLQDFLLGTFTKLI
jgi:hypothetical protein